MADRSGWRGFLTARRLSWRTFWAKRALWRIDLIKVFVIVSMLIVVYLVIPGDWRSQINEWLQTLGRIFASLSASEILVGLVALLVIVGLLLVFVRPYRRATYLAVSPESIPKISVYVDAENQLTHSEDIPPFIVELVRYLNGRRADLLFFMDSSSKEHGAQTDQFRMLTRYGFHPIHVPRSYREPSKDNIKKVIKEAVDKELAMHAYERALLGPADQEFIIVTADQDFVALVYRLAALGHHVQLWATPILPAYRELQSYLDVELLDMARLVSEAKSAPLDAGDWNGEVEEIPLSLESGAQQLYRAIVGTVNARNACEEGRKGLNVFKGKFSAELAPRLRGVGYSATSKTEYWLVHMYTLEVLKPGNATDNSLPGVGNTDAEAAAEAVFLAARLTAKVAIELGEQSADGAVTFSDIAKGLMSQESSNHLESMLLDLVRPENSKRFTHVFYFLFCAEAVGLVAFDRKPRQGHVIYHPRLPA